MTIIHGSVTSETTVKTRLTMTGGDIECMIRMILEREGTIASNQAIDFDWDIAESFVRELLVTWEAKT